MILVTVVALTIYVYKKFYGIKASNETYTEAVEYYEDGKYEPAMNRLEVLFNEGWDGYGIFHYISQIYEQQGEYRFVIQTNSIFFTKLLRERECNR